MLIIFCADPLQRAKPDPAYAEEYVAAQKAAARVALLDLEALLAGDENAAIRQITTDSTPEIAIYRGWMLRRRQYARLYTALETRRVALINSPRAYNTCHYLPLAYPYLQGHTPATVWAPVTAEPGID